MNPLIQSKNATILPVVIALTLGCFGLSPLAALARLEENLGAAELAYRVTICGKSRKRLR